MSEFNWWLLIVGLVVGAGLVWLVLADSARREAEVDERELPAEAAWIAEAMSDLGRPIDPSDAEEVLRLHRAYLTSPPPDDAPPDELEADAGTDGPTAAGPTGEPAGTAEAPGATGRQRGEPAA